MAASSRPNILLVSTGVPHGFDNLFTLLGGQATMLSDDLAEDHVNFTRHVGRVAADIKVRLLLQEIVDKSAVLLELVLHVDLVGTLAGKCGDDLEVVTKFGGIGLRNCQFLESKSAVRFQTNLNLHPTHPCTGNPPLDSCSRKTEQ